MVDEAQDEHVVEEEKTCNGQDSNDNASSLVVEADGHNIEYAFWSQIGSIISD